MPIVTKEIPPDKTGDGEDAPEILVRLESRTIYVSQSHAPRVSIVGMSFDQASAVRDALNEFLKAAK